MFIWVRVKTDAALWHADHRSSANDIEDSIYSQSRANGVLISKGSWFGTPATPESLYLRLTLAAADEAALETAVGHFAGTLDTVLPLNMPNSQPRDHGNTGRSTAGVIKNGCSDKFIQKAGSKSCNSCTSQKFSSSPLYSGGCVEKAAADCMSA